MKKIIIWLLTFILVSVSTYTYWSQVITLITETGKYEEITIASWEATVFGFPRKIENITFSKDSGFTIRTLEWWVWKDLSNNITDYSPITWILARNISEWDLVITAKYADVTSIENSIFQKSLKAGWNLISPAFKDDINWIVYSETALWESLPYSQILDFTWNGFVYSWEAVITTPNHNLNDSLYEIKTKVELSNASLIEKLAYGLFINVDSVISGSQEMTTEEVVISCDEVSQLLGLCGETTLPAPENLAVDGTSTWSVTLTWNSVVNAVNYKIEYLTEVDALLGLTWNKITSWLIEWNLAEITWLESNTNYLFNIYAIDENWNIGELSNVVTATTVNCSSLDKLFNRCGPENLHSTFVWTWSINLEWNEIVGATNYIVYYGTWSNQYTSTGETLLNTSIWLSLNEWTQYYFAVTAIINGWYETNKSKEINITTLATCDEVSAALGLCDETWTWTVVVPNPLVTTNTLWNIQSYIWEEIVVLEELNVKNNGSDWVINSLQTTIMDVTWEDNNTINPDYITSATLFITDQNDIQIQSQNNSNITASWVITFDNLNLDLNTYTESNFSIRISIANDPSIVWREISNENTILNYTKSDSSTWTLITCDEVSQLLWICTPKRIITVQFPGELTLTADSNNIDNQDIKTILAWEEMIIYSVDALAQNENVNVETVTFTLDNNLKNEVASAKLYLDDTLIATASNSAVSNEANSIITFDNITGLEIGTTTTQELKLAIVTENIWFEKVGETVTNVSVTKVSLPIANWVNTSTEVIVNDLTTTASNTFDVVPVKITASVVSLLSSGQAGIKFTANAGNNTQPTSVASPVVTVDKLVFTSLGSEDLYQIYEINDSGSALVAAWINTNAALAPINGLTFSDNVTIAIIPAWNMDQTYALKLNKTGFEYIVDGGALLNINSTTELDLGTKTY